MKRFLPALLLPLLLSSSLAYSAVFEVVDIRIEGLQRVSAGTVFGALPINAGDLVDDAAIRAATRSLFRTGYFNDITMYNDGGVLVIAIVERPSVSEINLEGNKAIETDQLMGALRDNGLAEGQIFRQTVLDGMSQELQRQYVSQGRYSAVVKTEIRQLPRNRVAVDINIDEGSVASIRHINIVGNEIFSDEDLTDEFELKTGGWFSWFSSSNKYNREKLTGDLERLESWYLDRGYLQFAITSSQVSISPDKESVFITVNINEGDVYKVESVELAGELVIPEESIRRLIFTKPGDTYSQAVVTQTSELITRVLGNDGYTFADVKGFPDLNEETQTAKLTFVIDPGKRAYVRRINFEGNTKTSDEVLRREMRQMEGASANSALIDVSKVRLERLGFFKEVNVENVPVAGSDDQIDVVYTVEEQPSGSVGASVGYAQGTGIILGANLQENNFLGSGRQIGLGLNRNRYQESASINFNEPYFTVDGVSAGVSVFVRKTDYSDFGTTDFNTESFGTNLNWSYPVSDIARIGFGVGYENLKLSSAGNTSREVRTFFNDNGTDFDLVTLNLNWVRSTLNRGVFATAGSQLRVGLESAVPGSNLEYYRFSLNGQYIYPITQGWSLKFRTDLGYADAFGDTTELPFFKNYYTGGLGSVRGFERNGLGPRETLCTAKVLNTTFAPPTTTGSYDHDGNTATAAFNVTDLNQVVVDPAGDGWYFCNNDYYLGLPNARPDAIDPIGGNFLTEFGMDLIFPLPFIKDQRTMQSAFFVDAGNVFDTGCEADQLNCSDFDVGELRYSVGVGVTWLSGFGPLTFSFGKAFNFSEFDDREFFQFSIGQTF